MLNRNYLTAAAAAAMRFDWQGTFQINAYADKRRSLKSLSFSELFNPYKGEGRRQRMDEIGWGSGSLSEMKEA